MVAEGVARVMINRIAGVGSGQSESKRQAKRLHGFGVVREMTVRGRKRLRGIV